MRRRFKRALMAVGIVLSAAVLCCAALAALFKSTPEWYEPPAVATSEHTTAAASAENKIAEMHNWVQRVHADDVRADAARKARRPPPATRAAPSYEITLSQREVNDLLDKWSSFLTETPEYGGYISDPRIIVRDARVILAGRVKDLGSIASVHMEPRLNVNGSLRLDVVRVMGGRLPLPEMLWRSQRQRAVDALQRRIGRWQASADFDKGAANGPATLVAMSRLFFSALEGRDADPFIYLPLSQEGRSLPVRVTKLAIDGHAVTVGVHAITDAEADQLLQRIRGPQQD